MRLNSKNRFVEAHDPAVGRGIAARFLSQHWNSEFPDTDSRHVARPREIAFIDPRIAGVEALVAQWGGGVEVCLFNLDEDGLSQVAALTSSLSPTPPPSTPATSFSAARRAWQDVAGFEGGSRLVGMGLGVDGEFGGRISTGSKIFAPSPATPTGALK